MESRDLRTVVRESFQLMEEKRSTLGRSRRFTQYHPHEGLRIGGLVVQLTQGLMSGIDSLEEELDGYEGDVYGVCLLVGEHE